MDLNVIGIAGVARVGKDTFCSEVINYLKKEGVAAERLAFADALKDDLRTFLLDKTGVDVYSDKDNHKILLRPILVSYGKLMRDLSRGMYWINKIKKNVEENSKRGVVSIISDVRYPNEAQWINSEAMGVTVHLTRHGIHCANEEESINDPLTKEKSLYCLDWPNLHPDDIAPEALKHIYEIKLQHSNRPSINKKAAGAAR